MHTIDSLIRESCNRHGDKPALRQKIDGVWQETTYNELWLLSDRIAAGLARTGFDNGDHAALLAPSSPQWVAAYLGILKAGGVAIPIDKELKGAELRHVLIDSDAKLVFSAHPCLELLLEVAKDIPALSQIVQFTAPTGGDSDSRLSQLLDALLEEWRDLVNILDVSPGQTQRIELLARRIYRMISARSEADGKRQGLNDPFGPTDTVRNRLIREGRLLELDALCHDAPPPGNQRNPGDTAVVLYTSGTTGRSKGAMLSHANIVANIQGAINHFKLDDTIHTLSFLPINHVFEQVCGVLLPLALGGTVSFCDSLKKLGENLAEVKPTFLLGVPAVYRMLLDRIMKNIGSKRLSHLFFSFPLTRLLVTAKVRQAFGAGTVFISGGAALDPTIAEGLTKLGLTIYQGYGITETSPIISAEQPGQKRLGTVGLPLHGVEMRIASPDGEQVGEILVKGHNVMQGYYKNPQATMEAIVDGWYRTGDLGRIDGDGFLTICGRVKNLIVTPNGKNVYPEEVENELLKSPFIAEVMVYGHHIGPAMEEVHAMVYPNQEALDDYCRAKGACPVSEADVEALLRREIQSACSVLADYKRVRRFTIREDEFPKTTTRKIKRFAVEARVPTVM
ncbi:MAG: AMP-dependent synthetase [Geobacter sp.]|nr:MAG: AMP-dependent synthetase [Geobacter sp.]